MSETLTPLMVDASEAARLIGVSESTWWRMDAAGKTPAPVRLSRGTTRWRVSGPKGLTAWCEHGCPSRVDWQAAHEQGGTPR